MAARQAKLIAVALLILCGANSPGSRAESRGPDQPSRFALGRSAGTDREAVRPANAGRERPDVAQAERSAPQSGTATRIVSLVPNVTEMLFAIGAGRQVVGVSSYDDFPPETKTLPRVGALLDPDTERIFALRPDLVIVYGSQTELEGQFARAGIRVFAYRHSGVDNVLQTIRELGRITGRATDGDRVARNVQSQLDDIRRRVRGQRRPRTMIVVGRDAGVLRGVYVSGGIGFLHELLDIAGGDDAFADIKREAVQPSNEIMIVRAPEVIIELHAGDEPSRQTVQRERAVWNLLASVPAVRNGRVHLFYGGYLLAAGPRLGRASETLARVLHANVFAGAGAEGPSRP